MHFMRICYDGKLFSARRHISPACAQFHNLFLNLKKREDHLRRGICFLCVLMIVFFSACTAGDNQKLLANITDLYATAGEFDSRVSITVELPQRTATYVIDWQYAAGKSILTVAEPEQIAGITAETEDNGLTFHYEDAVLVVDSSGDGISPIEVLPELYFGWSGGLVKDFNMETYQDEDALAVTYSQERGTNEYTQRVWFDPVRLTPLYAEFYQGDALALTCEFLTFHINV